MDEVKIARLLFSVEREERDKPTSHRLTGAFIRQLFEDSDEEVVGIDDDEVDDSVEEEETVKFNDEVGGTDFDDLEYLSLQIRLTNQNFKMINW